MSTLSLRGIHVAFETEQGILHAVDGVDLDVPSGACLGLVGESGSGKSQLFLAALGLAPASARVSGSVRLDGKQVSGDELAALRGRTLGIVVQDAMSALTPHLTVRAQLEEMLFRHRSLRAAPARAAARDLLERVGLPDPQRQLERYPHQLSGGMRQRALLALALASQPRWLILDEPTSALDVTVQAGLLELLASLRRDGLGLVVITHDFGVVASLADRVAVMYAGRIVEEAPAGLLFAGPRHPYTAALVAASPTLETPIDRELPMLPGQPPSGVSPEPGCAFAPRCTAASPVCTQRAPPLTEADDAARRFACHHPLAGMAR